MGEDTIEKLICLNQRARPEFVLNVPSQGNCGGNPRTNELPCAPDERNLMCIGYIAVNEHIFDLRIPDMEFGLCADFVRRQYPFMIEQDGERLREEHERAIAYFEEKISIKEVFEFYEALRKNVLFNITLERRTKIILELTAYRSVNRTGFFGRPSHGGGSSGLRRAIA
jgi:hypothetical protein